MEGFWWTLVKADEDVMPAKAMQRAAYFEREFAMIMREFSSFQAQRGIIGVIDASLERERYDFVS